MKKEESYWNKSEKELFGIFSTSREGLAEKEVEERRKKYGYNQLKRKKQGLRIFLRQFKSPLVWLLIATSVISMFFGEKINALIILTIIFLISIISFSQEYRSERIVEDLIKKISHNAKVIRQNEKIEIDARDLVPGDIVLLSIGSKVPADLRLIETKNLEINEAALTGESIPVHKTSSLLNKVYKSKYFEDYAFAGTIVSDGEGIGIVLSTGENTELGKLSKETVSERPETEFQKGIKGFVRFLIYIVAVLTIIIFSANFIFGRSILDSILFALAIAIGIAPEMLPMIITIGLSRGAKVMSKKDVIVKRLISIEDFGNMDVLCTDKTGTLTEGNIKLYDHFDANNKGNENILLYGLLCNSAIVHGKKISGNPIDVAIWQHASESMKEKIKGYEKIKELPFDYNRKRMSVVVKNKGGEILLVKGAPQSILGICSKIYINGRVQGISRYENKIDKKFVELSEQGLRVIAIAYKKCEKKNCDVKDEKDLIYLGFITLSDPPKKKIKASLNKLKSLSIDLKILTGDNEIITEKIAQEVGIKIEKITLGDEIEKSSDDELKKIVEETNIFCRLTPLHKQRIIKALKSNGHDVGYMGDGINDIVALHEADVGISVDDAVDVAKDTSDIILMKKNLDILADGVIEGRKIFGNAMKYILMGVSSDFGNMLSMSLASFFLPFLPMLPTQVLLNDLLYDVSQTPISYDNVDLESLKKPKKFNIASIKKYMFWFGPMGCIVDLIIAIALIFLFKSSMIMFRTGWFIESIVSQTLVVFVIRTRHSPFWKSKPGKGILISCIGVVLTALIIPFTPLKDIFGFTLLPPLFYLFLLIATGTYLLLTELGKRIFFKKYDI
jgi:P-type Mg2+ transporter